MQAVEFRCELRDPDLARLLLGAMGALSAGTIEGDDTHFRVPAGFLKRRTAPGEPTDYVLYNKPARVTPRMTRFEVMTETDARVQLGSAEMPVWVTVRKTREIYLVNGINVYLDRVEGLGWFFKAEVIVSPRVNVIKAHERINGVRDELANAFGEAVSGSYAELLADALQQESA
ncbi:MAG: CYTH domain-containing protein [Planctomycetota bacterium]